VLNLANLLYIIALARGIGQSGNIFGLAFAELPMFFEARMGIVLLLFVWVRENGRLQSVNQLVDAIQQLPSVL